MLSQTPRVVGTKSSQEPNSVQFTDAADAWFVEKLDLLEVRLFSIASFSNATMSTVDGRYQLGIVLDSLEGICKEMLKFCSDLLLVGLISKEESEEVDAVGAGWRIEFGRVERNKLIRRLLECLLFVVNQHGNLTVVSVRILELVNVLMDLHYRCACRIGIIDNFEEIGKELTIVNSLIYLDLYLVLTQITEISKEVFVNILYCVKSLEDFEKFENPETLQIIKRVVDGLLNEIIWRSINTPSLRGLVENTIQCLINCTTISSLFRGELARNFVRVVKLSELPFGFGTYKIFGEFMAANVGVLSRFYQLQSYYLINYTELTTLVNLNYLADMTNFLLGFYLESGCKEADNSIMIMDTLVLLFSLSVAEKNFTLFSPKRTAGYISQIKAILQSNHTSSSSKISIISIIRKWMEIYSNHITNNCNITCLVEEILSQNLPLSIFCLLADSQPNLTLSINNFLSWLVSSLNSNDITQIHKFSEFVALNVITPFSMGKLPLDADLQPILNKLLQEPRLITILTENKVLALIEEKSLEIDENTRKLMLETEKEQAKFTLMLKALPPNDKNLLQITEGNLFINKLQ